MPILLLNISDIRSKTEAFTDVCHQCRVSTIHIDPDLFEEMRTAALAHGDMSEYNIIRELATQYMGRNRRNLHIQVLFQISSSLLSKILGNPRYGSGEGRRRVLTQEEEEMVVQHIQACQREHNPITVSQATTWINTILLTDGRSVSESYLCKNANIMRHFKRIAPSQVEAQRQEASIYSNVLPFFERLHHAFSYYKYDPDLVINFDETSAGAKELKKGGGRVLCDPTIGVHPQRSTQDKQEHVTLSCGVSASGKRMPPIYLLRNKTITSEFFLTRPYFDFGPYGFQYSPKGYQTKVNMCNMIATRALY